jgi:hypothetical protein
LSDGVEDVGGDRKGRINGVEKGETAEKANRVVGGAIDDEAVKDYSDELTGYAARNTNKGASNNVCGRSSSVKRAGGARCIEDCNEGLQARNVHVDVNRGAPVRIANEGRAHSLDSSKENRADERGELRGREGARRSVITATPLGRDEALMGTEPPSLGVRTDNGVDDLGMADLAGRGDGVDELGAGDMDGNTKLIDLVRLGNKLIVEIFAAMGNTLGLGTEREMGVVTTEERDLLAALKGKRTGIEVHGMESQHTAVIANAGTTRNGRNIDGLRVMKEDDSALINSKKELMEILELIKSARKDSSRKGLASIESGTKGKREIGRHRLHNDAAPVDRRTDHELALRRQKRPVKVARTKSRADQGFI